MQNLTFLIIGVQKAGTTALAYFLGQHPDICMADKKEVHLFDAPEYNSEWDIGQINALYAKHFSHYKNETVLGEATPIYFYWPGVISELKKYNSELKLIILLRDPVERAISHYMMEVGRNNESVPMLYAFLMERFRSNRKGDTQKSHTSRRLYSYISRGLYAEQLQNLRIFFPDKQILIIENNELLNFHESTLETVFNFLNVDSTIIPPAKQVFTRKDSAHQDCWYKWFLSQYYKYRNRHLKRILLEMNYNPDWRWL